MDRNQKSHSYQLDLQSILQVTKQDQFQTLKYSNDVVGLIRTKTVSCNKMNAMMSVYFQINMKNFRQFC